MVDTKRYKNKIKPPPKIASIMSLRNKMPKSFNSHDNKTKDPGPIATIKIVNIEKSPLSFRPNLSRYFRI